MISGAGRSFTYDYDNRPTSIVYNSTYVISVYDAYGNRVKKVTPNSTTIYIGKLYECTNGVCTKYIFAGDERIAKVESSETYFYHTDHLGSSYIITDSLGSTVQDIYYYPYGEIKTNTGSDIARHKFTGQEWDAETGLYYYGARYYDPRLARFISADTIVPDPRNPQSLNRYSYVLNNPLKYIDPSGHGFLKKLWKSIKKAFKKVVKEIIEPAVAAVTTFVFSGGNPVVAVAAAVSTVALDTGTGRKIVRSFSREIFDEILGINDDKLAHILSYMTLDAVMTWGITKGYNYFVSGGERYIGRGLDSRQKVRFDMKVDHSKWLTFGEWKREEYMLLAFNEHPLVGQVKDPYYWSRSWNQVKSLSATIEFGRIVSNVWRGIKPAVDYLTNSSKILPRPILITPFDLRKLIEPSPAEAETLP